MHTLIVFFAPLCAARFCSAASPGLWVCRTHRTSCLMYTILFACAPLNALLISLASRISRTFCRLARASAACLLLLRIGLPYTSSAPRWRTPAGGCTWVLPASARLPRSRAPACASCAPLCLPSAATWGLTRRLSLPAYRAWPRSFSGTSFCRMRGPLNALRSHARYTSSRSRSNNAHNNTSSYLWISAASRSRLFIPGSPRRAPPSPALLPCPSPLSSPYYHGPHIFTYVTSSCLALCACAPQHSSFSGTAINTSAGRLTFLLYYAHALSHLSSHWRVSRCLCAAASLYRIYSTASPLVHNIIRTLRFSINMWPDTTTLHRGGGCLLPPLGRRNSCLPCLCRESGGWEILCYLCHCHLCLPEREEAGGHLHLGRSLGCRMQRREGTPGREVPASCLGRRRSGRRKEGGGGDTMGVMGREGLT